MEFKSEAKSLMEAGQPAWEDSALDNKLDAIMSKLNLEQRGKIVDAVVKMASGMMGK